MTFFLTAARRVLLCCFFSLIGIATPSAEDTPNVLIQVESTGDGLVGDVFAAMFVGENGPVGSNLYASPSIEATLPPGEYTVVLIRSNDQKTIQLTLTAGTDLVTSTAEMPPLAEDAQRMRLVKIAAIGAEPSKSGWFWQFVQGDRIVVSRAVAEPAITTPLPVGEYVVRLRRGSEEIETRASLNIEVGTGLVEAKIDWDPRPISDDAVARARIIPRTEGAETQTAATDSPAETDAAPQVAATYDAQISQIVVRITEGTEGLNGGTIWLTDGEGPGGLDVAFIDQRGEARFSTLNISSDQLAVEVRDASGLNIQARTIVEDWK